MPFDGSQISETAQRLIAEIAVSKTTNRGGLHPQTRRTKHLPRTPAARARGDRSAGQLPVLRRNATAQCVPTTFRT